jgi:hypothetical protein
MADEYEVKAALNAHPALISASINKWQLIKMLENIESPGFLDNQETCFYLLTITHRTDLLIDYRKRGQIYFSLFFILDFPR